MDAKALEETSGSARARITVIAQNRHILHAGVITGRQLKELIDVPGGSTLHRKGRDGNEPINDDDAVDVRNGDHFFKRLLRPN